MKRRPLSPNQIQWLRDLVAGVNPWDRKHGRAQRGGSTQTEDSLWRAGYTDLLGDITPKGRDAVAPVVPKVRLTGVRYIGGHHERMLDAIDKKFGKPKEPKKP